jgi:hypothetical protein
MISKYYIGLIILLLLPIWSGCNEALPPLIVNPYDPNASNFIGDPAGQFTLESLSKNKIKLSWAKGSTNGIGFQLERTNLSTLVSDNIIVDKSTKYFVDSSLDYASLYRYRISARTYQTNYPFFTDSIKVAWSFYQYSTALNGASNYYISGNSQRVLNSLLNIYQSTGSTYLYLKHLNLSLQSLFGLSYDGKYSPYASSNVIGYYNIDNDSNIVLRNSTATGSYYSLSMSRDNKFLACLLENGLIEIWDLNTGLVRDFLPGSSMSGINNIVISPDNMFITASDRNYIYLWNLNDFTLYAKIPSSSSSGHSNYIFDNESSELIFYGEESSSIYFWDINLKNVKYIIPGNGRNISDMNLFDNGKYFAIYYSAKGTDSPSYIFWELLNNEPKRSFSPLVIPQTYTEGKIASNGNIILFYPPYATTEDNSHHLTKPSYSIVYWYLGGPWVVKY